MTTPEQQDMAAMAEVERMIARARPEQILRLLEDIKEAGPSPRQGECTSQRRAS